MSYIKVHNRQQNRINVPNFLSGMNAKYDESVLTPSVASDCYNFDFTSGALKGCEGFQDLNVEAESVWTYKDYLMYCRNGEIFYKKGDDEAVKLEGITLTGIPQAIGYRLYGEDVILICSPSDNMVVWNGKDEAFYVSSSPLITSMTVHYERMFVTTSNEVNTLWFSDDLDPTNWNAEMSEGGFIELADERGALLKALGFLNYVYIFRERGISRLTAYADQSEFSVSHLFVTGGKIFGRSIALCGDKVIFASSDGIFVFDGVSTRRILANLDGLLHPDENSVAVYHGGKYYLALKAAFNGKVDENCVNNAILIYDNDGKYTLMRGYDVSEFHSSGDALYAIINNKICLLNGLCPFDKSWRVPMSDLGSGRLKRVKKLYIDTATDITVTVTLDDKTKDFLIKGKDTTSCVIINMIGRKFAMTIKCNENSPIISRPQLTFCFADF